MSQWIPTDVDVDDVVLHQSPLELVILQLQFPSSLVRLRSALEHGALQERLAEDYPYEEKQVRPNFTIDPSGVTRTDTTVRVLNSVDRKWAAMAADDSISLVGQAYTTREDFLERVETLLDHVTAVAKPPGFARLGVRYINRVHDALASPEWLETLAPGVRGALDVLGRDQWGEVTESLVTVAVPASVRGSVTRARWGLIPPNSTLDPSLPPASAASWVLDIDSAIQHEGLEPWASTKDVVAAFTKDAYRVFRSVVNDAALERFDPQW